MKKIVLAITGASGAIYPKLFLENIKKETGIELFIVASQNAHKVFQEELSLDLKEFASQIFNPKDFDVPYVSGSAKIDAMVILPCSMGTLGRIAHGISDCAITRAADVMLKEKRQLIVAPRETPLNTIHLRNMTTLSECGATILPAMPSFYSHQKSIEEAALSVISRVFDHIGLDHNLMERWKS